MRHKTYSAAFVMFIRQGQVLLQQRQNTGYMDGYYDMGVSGHVEAGESVRQAAMRESLEEVGIVLQDEQLELVTVIHNQTAERTYYYFYFAVKMDSDNAFVIGEPHKIAQLEWFPLEQLPDQLIHYNRLAVENFLAGVSYAELGWERKA